MANLIVCADDYAQSAAIDQAILQLINAGVLSASSCLTQSPRWQTAASLLSRQVRQQADIGLHLDFTQFSSPLRLPHPALVWRSLCRGLNAAAIQETIQRQLDSFEQALGHNPDYIDGHLHVHQLPQIREILMDELRKRYHQLPESERPWIRIARPPAASGYKAVVIGLLGARALAKLASQAGFRISPMLLGVYDFRGNTADYQQHWQRWVQQAQDMQPASASQLPPVLMCHPAVSASALKANLDEPANLVDPEDLVEPDDPILTARITEWQTLQSPTFNAWLQDSGIRPVKGRG